MIEFPLPMKILIFMIKTCFHYMIGFYILNALLKINPER